MTTFGRQELQRQRLKLASDMAERGLDFYAMEAKERVREGHLYRARVWAFWNAAMLQRRNDWRTWAWGSLW